MIKGGKFPILLKREAAFEIRMKVRFNEEIQEPIMAYTFKNIQGTKITEVLSIPFVVVCLTLAIRN